MKLQPLLTPEEHKRLSSLETVIDKGRKTWIAAGEALLEIRDSKLYRQAFKTFEDYCQEKWGWTRKRAYELMQSVEVVKTLPEKCNQLVTNPHQAAELATVEPEDRVQVVKQAAAKAEAEDRTMTARDIKEAAFEVCGKEQEDFPEPAPAPPSEKHQAEPDATPEPGPWLKELNRVVYGIVTNFESISVDDLRAMDDIVINLQSFIEQAYREKMAVDGTVRYATRKRDANLKMLELSRDYLLEICGGGEVQR